MIALTSALADVSRVATSGLVSAIWQGVLLTAAVGLGLRLLPKTPAAVRFAIWFAVFLVVTALPFASLLPHAAGVVAANGHGAWLTLDPRWSLAIAAVWAVASLGGAGTLVLAALRVRALWKRATPLDVEGAIGLHPTLRKGAKDGAPGLKVTPGLLRRVQICTSDEVDRPTVIGFFSPKILIPGWLLHKLTPAELEQIVLHEAGHLGRADDWMNLLQKVALVVFPLNPALAWVERRLCFERELACDERVLHATGAPKAYAACLAALAEYRLQRRGLARGLALVLGALGRESELGHRVGKILRRGERMKPLHAKLVLGGAMLGLVAAATGLERCPQVVGFAAPGTQTVAHVNQWQPTHGGETAVNGAPIRRVHAVRTTFDNREVQQTPNEVHETLLRASMPSSQEKASIEATDDSRNESRKTGRESARMMRTAAATDSSYRKRFHSISDVEPSRPADGVMQWVVVSSWSDADGDRMVLATAISNGTPGRAAETQTPASQQVHPYAAVPVRDGWLVFQL